MTRPRNLRQRCGKILAYENSLDFGAWRRQVNFVAGLGGFGAVADAVMEAAAKSLICEGVPAAYSTSMTYGSWQSPYCPDPRRFQQITIERLNEGSLFWVYMGHGRQSAVDEVMVPGAAYPILSSDEACQLACRRGAPIACLLACYSGAYDQPGDCLAEDLLRCPGGPVAVLCGSRVTMPYAMSVMGSELLRACFAEHALSLGDALLTAKRRMMEDDGHSPHRAALDATAKALSPNASELQAELAEHLDLFNLLGDPLLRIAYPHELEVKIDEAAIAGGTLDVAISSPIEGTATMEFALRRDRLTFQPPRRRQYDPQALDDYRSIYERANRSALSSRRFRLAKGESVVPLTVPPAAGALVTCAFLSRERRPARSVRPMCACNRRARRRKIANRARTPRGEFCCACAKPTALCAPSWVAQSLGGWRRHSAVGKNETLGFFRSVRLLPGKTLVPPAVNTVMHRGAGRTGILHLALADDLVFAAAPFGFDLVVELVFLVVAVCQIHGVPRLGMVSRLKS